VVQGLSEAKELLCLELHKAELRPTRFNRPALLEDSYQQDKGLLVRCSVNGRCTLVGDVVETVTSVALHQLVWDQVWIDHAASAPVEHIWSDDDTAPVSSANFLCEMPGIRVSGLTHPAIACASHLLCHAGYEKALS
jgi:hypothetical protein